MDNTIAVRPASYGKFEDNAFPLLQQAGIKNVEIAAPNPDQIEAVQARLNEYGLQATTLTGRTKLDSEDAAKMLEPAFKSAQAMGVTILFISVKAGDMPKEKAYERLREIGDLAARYGVTVAVETHPDLAQNGTVALQTMLGVNHPNVRINFDPANIHYYNEGIDTVEELKRILPYVASVHLKDTNGGYKTWNFPALGEGVVNFKEIFRIMNERGFNGPFTMEIEGIEGEEFTEELAQQRIVDSLEHLRQIGVV